MAQETSSTVVQAEQALATSNGREFQNANKAYLLPTDRSEHTRLDLQHEVLRLMLDGELYQIPELVKATLSPQENLKHRVLDVGAGSGKWAIDMAEEFPHVDVLGIDLVQPNVLSDPSRHVPPNCSFQIADANKDMEKIDSVYDLVHFRCVEAGIHDSDLFFYDAARVLRPDVKQLVDETGKLVPLQKPGGDGMDLVKSSTASGLTSSLDLDETERRLARSMQANILRLFPAFKAILLRDKSLPEEFVNDLADGAVKEVQELPSVVHKYTKWVFATAVRNNIPWNGRMKPWQEPPGYDLDDYFVRPLAEE
ncbi:hypothetical protein FS837_008333 [Tulasnella sp. UAMH 9824]|nr:hypothetical protein FS837_008333 [Tulasnella sp. UAMH 9824]